MQTQDVEIKNRAGLHARPASLIVNLANTFKSEVFMEKDGNNVNAKSIMAVMTLGAGHKSIITIKTDGEDETEALGAIVNLFDKRFEEE